MNRHGFECVLGHFLPKAHIFLSEMMLSCFVEKNVHLEMTAIINIFYFYTMRINKKIIFKMVVCILILYLKCHPINNHIESINTNVVNMNYVFHKCTMA